MEARKCTVTLKADLTAGVDGICAGRRIQLRADRSNGMPPLLALDRSSLRAPVHPENEAPMSEPIDPAVIDHILAELAAGKSLSAICKAEGMPDRVTVWRWSKGDNELAARILEAREFGFQLRAEAAVEAAKCAKDPVAGRLAFDAERWYLGKLSQAFAEKPIAIGALVNVDAGDTFAAVAGALERAAEAISSRSSSTILLVDESEAGPDPAAG
jgi:hypothetical protein